MDIFAAIMLFIFMIEKNRGVFFTPFLTFYTLFPLVFIAWVLYNKYDSFMALLKHFVYFMVLTGAMIGVSYIYEVLRSNEDNISSAYSEFIRVSFPRGVVMIISLLLSSIIFSVKKI